MESQTVDLSAQTMERMLAALMDLTAAKLVASLVDLKADWMVDPMVSRWVGVMVEMKAEWKDLHSVATTEIAKGSVLVVQLEKTMEKAEAILLEIHHKGTANRVLLRISLEHQSLSPKSSFLCFRWSQKATRLGFSQILFRELFSTVKWVLKSYS